jgi:transposase-like protein
MPWKTMDIQEQRVRFVVAAHRREKAMAALCQEFGISCPVGYEWLRRYRQGGISAIAERSRRPQESPRRTEAAVEKRAQELRKQYPDGGARKLCVLLEREHIKLARNTIHRILLRHDLVHEEDRAGGPSLNSVRLTHRLSFFYLPYQSPLPSELQPPSAFCLSLPQAHLSLENKRLLGSVTVRSSM